jgi:hypothetical protein
LPGFPSGQLGKVEFAGYQTRGRSTCVANFLTTWPPWSNIVAKSVERFATEKRMLGCDALYHRHTFFSGYQYSLRACMHLYTYVHASMFLHTHLHVN